MRISALLALMSVLTESLFTLMSSHLVALFLFTVWHNVLSFKWLIYSFRQIIVFAVEAWHAAFLTPIAMPQMVSCPFARLAV